MSPFSAPLEQLDRIVQNVNYNLPLNHKVHTADASEIVVLLSGLVAYLHTLELKIVELEAKDSMNTRMLVDHMERLNDLERRNPGTLRAINDSNTTGKRDTSTGGHPQSGNNISTGE